MGPPFLLTFLKACLISGLAALTADAALYFPPTPTTSCVQARCGGCIDEPPWSHFARLRRCRASSTAFAPPFSFSASRRPSSSSLWILQNTPNDDADPRFEPRVAVHVRDVELPLGLVLEEMDASDPSFGVIVAGMSPGGNAARYNAAAALLRRRRLRAATEGEYGAKSEEAGGEDGVICIRDKILAVNGEPCEGKSLVDVLALFAGAAGPVGAAVSLLLGRIDGCVELLYSGGECVSAKPGENFGFLARRCGVDIEYSCRSGVCRTCERAVETDRDHDGEEPRRILHCRNSVPRGFRFIRIIN